MYHGRIVEMGPAGEVYHSPRHPYTIALLGAVLSIDPRQRRLSAATTAAPGEPSNVGCAYANRCPSVMDHCRVNVPQVTVVDGVSVRCHLYADRPAPDVVPATDLPDGHEPVPSL